MRVKLYSIGGVREFYVSNLCFSNCCCSAVEVGFGTAAGHIYITLQKI